MVRPTVKVDKVMSGRKFKTVASYIGYLLQLPPSIELNKYKIQNLISGIQQKMSTKLIGKVSRRNRLIWYNTVTNVFEQKGRKKLFNQSNIDAGHKDNLNAVTRTLKMSAIQREDFKVWFTDTQLIFKNRKGVKVPKWNRALKTGRRYLSCYKNGSLNKKLLNIEFQKEAPNGHQLIHDGFTSIGGIYFKNGVILPTKQVKTNGILPQKAKFNKYSLPTEGVRTGEHIGQLLHNVGKLEPMKKKTPIGGIGIKSSCLCSVA